MLKRLVIDNYRSCVHTTLDLDPHLSVLIGPNGGGKTNILQTILLLHKLTLRQLGTDRVSAAGGSRIKASFQVGRVTADLKASFDGEPPTNSRLDAIQKWSLKEKNGQETSTDVPLAAAANLGREWSTRYYNSPWRFRGRVSKFHDRIPRWATKGLFEVAQFCQGIKYYSASQFTNPSSCPVSFEVDEEGSLQSYAGRLGGHLRVLYDMYTAMQSDKDGQFERFINIVGAQGLKLFDGLTFGRVRTSSTTYSVRVGGKVEARKRNKLLIVPQFKIGRLILSPNQLSEGTFKTLALLFYIITQASSALLIEEPEVCVHHGLLTSILELVKAYSQNRQTIISTHSDHVLDHVGPENVYSVRFDRKKGTVVRHIPKTMSRKEFLVLKDYLAREGNLGEYWREGGLGDGV